MTDTRRGPAALLVMEEERRADVYPPHVLDEIGELTHWQGPALTRDALRRDPGALEGWRSCSPAGAHRSSTRTSSRTRRS